jgi:hypothetical protein
MPDKLAESEPGPSFEPEIPSTPSLNDFGIDGSTLEGLKDPSFYQHFSAQKYRRTPAKFHHHQDHYAGYVSRDNESAPAEPTIDEFVRESMRALHIQTPVQVAEKYREESNSPLHREIETPQQIAARFPLVPPTPSTLQRLMSHRKVLTFHDTPEPASVVRQTRSRSKRMALRAVVDDKYTLLPNFVQSRVSVQMIIAACEQLQVAQEKAGPNVLSMESRDLTKLIATATGNKMDVNSLVVLALNKLEIVRVEKKPGQELQYIFDAS